jgi:DNA-binding regulatory protein, YebC/PmpR family
MAGHSKFKNIMYRKGAQDKKRASLFSKLSKEITVAAKLGAPDPDQNARLRSAIQLAKASSFPKENIDRAIKKSLDKDTVNYDQIRYEGFGPNGTSIIVEALTDNRNRTASNVRSAFQKFGGSMGETGSVSHAFYHYGFVRYKKDVTSEEDFFNFSIEGGAEDCFIEEDTYEAVSTPETLSNLYNYLDKKFGEPVSSGFQWKPVTYVAIEGDKLKSL